MLIDLNKVNSVLKYLMNEDDELLSETYDEKNKVPCNDDTMIYKIDVIKRKLYYFNIKTTVLCHSGLLLKTCTNKYYILEYGSGSSDMKNEIMLRDIKSMQVRKYSVLEEEYSWDRKHSRILKTPISISQIYNMMKENMTKRNYNVYYWNCHMAQEKLRSQLGLDVPVKYEYYVILLIFYILIFIFISSLCMKDFIHEF